MARRLRVDIESQEVLVPGAASSVVSPSFASNNNLDACDHGGRRYLAWRSAPTHFADRSAVINVVSRADGEWRHEHTVALGRDVREPRFWVNGDDLHLFFFTLGTDWTKFEPDRIHRVALGGTGWSDPAPVSEETDAVVWRVRVVDGTPLMTVYRGCGRLYTEDPGPTTVQFWTTRDGGVTWGPIDPARPDVHIGGTETEVVEHPSRGLVAISRMEGPTSFGSLIARVEGLEAPTWSSFVIPQKLDSPLLFRWNDEVLLIARRSPEFDGRYDLGLRELPPAVQTRIYHRVYWSTPKRTTLWRVHADAGELEPIADLPGHGDTCFPALVPAEDGAFTLYNYTSPLDGPDLPWVVGQFGPTEIYEATLRISTAD